MEGLKVMSFEAGHRLGIKCRFVSEWFKIDSYVPDKERLLSEIERNNPDVVVIDPNLYAAIDGIETTQRIRSQFDIPILYN
jgi:DNA-binding response OmpR family regulator